MPATLYNLANRSHHAEKAVTVPEEPAPVSVDIQTAPALAAIVEDAAASVPAETPDDTTASDTQEPVYPEWDSSWSKTQLLTVAQSLNLNVTSVNTKTEIINALTAATKA